MERWREKTKKYIRNDRTKDERRRKTKKHRRSGCCSFVRLVRLSELAFVVPKVHWSGNEIGFVSPKTRLSEGSFVRRFDSPKMK